MARTRPAPRRPRRPPPPTGRLRFAARLPILLFRAGLGPLLGGRLLLLHHTGRVSGLDRRAVLEVVTFDPAGPSWTIASGFGPRADWYLNLRRHPKTVIQFGNRHHAVTARFLPPEEGAAIMADYARRHPGRPAVCAPSWGWTSEAATTRRSGRRDAPSPSYASTPRPDPGGPDRPREGS